MNFKEAIRVLDIATDPRLAGRHTRTDYAVFDAALIFLQELEKQMSEASSREESKELAKEAPKDG